MLAIARAINLSGRFHIEIARIADQTQSVILLKLYARSSLVIALYWRRESAAMREPCHHALVQSIADGMSKMPKTDATTSSI
jgi:DNA-binding GntR family transcriptional regulator